MMLSNLKIDQILRKAGLHGDAINPIGNGHYNDSYYLDLEKHKYVLRIAPPDSIPKLFYEIDMMKSEINIHRLVKKHTDIPIPKIIYHNFARDIIDRDYFIMNYLEGNPGLFDEKELGVYVRQIHAITSEECGYPERAAPTGKSWPGIFYTYVEMIFNDCLSCGVIDNKEYGYFISIYDKYSDVFINVTPSLLHLDLWTQNILTVNGRITAILDFDRGLYGDPELEFAVLDTYGYSTPKFFEGYGRPRPVDSKALIRQKLYIVYELIKYAFIRVARGKSMLTGRSHVAQCRRILEDL